MIRDGDRACDGVDLRYRFWDSHGGYDEDILDTFDDVPCSVLEMMVALAIRCEEDIMDDPGLGSRVGQWFWAMIVSLGLGAMNDSRFDEEFVEDTIQKFLDRRYSANGKGGLFTIRGCEQDLRTVEIYCQMCWYLDTIA
jgi:hypothetical protein